MTIMTFAFCQATENDHISRPAGTQVLLSAQCATWLDVAHWVFSLIEKQSAKVSKRCSRWSLEYSLGSETRMSKTLLGRKMTLVVMTICSSIGLSVLQFRKNDSRDFLNRIRLESSQTLDTQKCRDSLSWCRNQPNNTIITRALFKPTARSRGGVD